MVVGPNCDRFSGETEELTRHHSRNTALDLVFLHRGRCLVSSVTFLRDLACRERVRNATRLGASSSIADCPSRCWNKRVYLLAICKENRFWKKRRDTMTHHTPRRFAWRSARLYPRMTRIFIHPDWVGIIDFETRLPNAVERAIERD